MSTTVHCTHCDTGFPVDPAKVPEGGVRARCTECEGIFRVELPDADGEGVGLSDSPRPAEMAPPETQHEEFGSVTDVVDPSAGESPAPGEPTDFDLNPFDEFDLGGPAGPAAVEETESGASETDPPAEVAEDAPSSHGEWVFEREDANEPTSVEVDRLDTVEEQVRGFQDESYEAPPSEGIERVVPGHEDEAFEGYTPLPMEESPSQGDRHAGESIVEEPPVEAGGDEVAPSAGPAAFEFGRRDPHDKARRLARVLVSDMITYNPDRHTRALEEGTLREDFEEEISKSWSEYVDQVGIEIAENTSYWSEALNEVLARGEELF
ncbi:MAG: zinc-ribbon domain-containing protein [Longimicrobiales bacterium]|nr:zinc-ribbon domain-containing protein [Longimicrobiales bacterium]